MFLCNACKTSAIVAHEDVAGADEQPGARTRKVANFRDDPVETFLLEGEGGEAPAPRRSRGRKGTGFVRKEDLDMEAIRSVSISEAEQDASDDEEAAAAPKRKGSRKSTGYVFKNQLEQIAKDLEARDSSPTGANSPETVKSGSSRGGRKVLFNTDANVTHWIGEKEKEADEVPRQWKRTSERKATGKAIQLRPEDISPEVRFQLEDDNESPVVQGGPVLLASREPRNVVRKPTGRPTKEQMRQVIDAQEADGEKPRPRVRKPTGHPSADAKRTSGFRRVLGKILGAS